MIDVYASEHFQSSTSMKNIRVKGMDWLEENYPGMAALVVMEGFVSVTATFAEETVQVVKRDLNKEQK